jgi:hypothetical protein
MQRLSFRKVNTSVYHVRQADEDILHFSLEDLLPAGHTLALNVSLGTLCLLSCGYDKIPRMLAEQQFTSSEICVLVPLLRAYPRYCPYEVLLASFNNPNANEVTIERCRQRLDEARLAGIWDQEMRPVRNVLSRTRLKMRTFNIEISSILETGYVLMYLPERKRLEA